MTKSNPQTITLTKRLDLRGRLIALLGVMGALGVGWGFTGCGGGIKLHPQEAEKELARRLGVFPYNLQVTIALRTTVILKVPPIPLREARQQSLTLIDALASYLQEKNITDLGSDSLIVTVRLDTNPDVYIQWRISSQEFLHTVKGEQNREDLLDRSIKEENWLEELG